MQRVKSDKADYLLYTKSAVEYDSVRFKGMAGSWGHRQQLVALQSFCNDWRGKRVLEIGCGTGRITESLASWGADVLATDITAEMIDVAKARLDGRDVLGTADFRVMSVFEIDIDLLSYDYVIMINVLGRLSEPGRAIEMIASRLSSQCRFIFTFPCTTSVLFPFALMVNARKKSLSRDVTSRWHTPSTIEGYCRAAGLNVVGYRGNHYVPVPRFLFWTLPFFWACEQVLATTLPKRCPSVFVECRRSAAKE